MNPLKHFGVSTEFIRGDTKSYNMRCPECGKHLTDADAYGHDCEAPSNDKHSKNLKQYNYRYTGASVAYGPIYANSKKEAKDNEREDIRRTLKDPKANLPKGFEVWETK